MRWPWPVLIVVGAVVTLLLRMTHLPAALLLGPMIAGIVVAGFGGTPQIPKSLVVACQAIVGCMIARMLTPDTFHQLSEHVLLFVLSTAGVVFIAAALGGAMTRLRLFPGTTAVWGSSPGAATAMVLLADANGADGRLVALMQYTRVLLVAVAASTVGRLSGGVGAAHAPTDWLAPVAWIPFAETMGIAASGIVLARFLPIPAGPLLIPIGVGSALASAGLVHIELPPLLLAVCYASIGVTVGLRFTKPILVHAIKVAPWILASNLLLIALCGGLALVVSRLGHVDLLTAYLATSPGGADSAAIIAASSNVDVSFVMALQIARALFVILTGSSLAKLVARLVTR